MVFFVSFRMSHFLKNGFCLRLVFQEWCPENQNSPKKRVYMYIHIYIYVCFCINLACFMLYMYIYIYMRAPNNEVGKHQGVPLMFSLCPLQPNVDQPLLGCSLRHS